MLSASKLVMYENVQRLEKAIGAEIRHENKVLEIVHEASIVSAQAGGEMEGSVIFILWMKI